MVIAVALFLDVFHGSTKNHNLKFHGYLVYFSSLFLAIFWATTIPFTRYLMGVHSLNQIVYGTSLGLWAALTMHFLLRDYLLEHFNAILNWHKKYSDRSVASANRGSLQNEEEFGGPLVQPER